MQHSHWDIQMPGSWGTILAIVLSLLLALLSFIHWRRGRLGYRQVILELLRLTVIVCLLLTLARPERIERESLQRDPELVILLDDTGSMASEDLVLPDNRVISRKEWLDTQLAREFQAPLASRYRVHQEQVSAYSQDPADPGAAPGTNLNAALRAVRERYANLRAVLVLSDGDWNLGGSPMVTAAQMRQQQTRVFAVGIGSDAFLPDLAMDDARAPAFAIRGERVVIPFRIQSRLQRDVQTTVRMTSSLGSVDEKSIFLPAGQMINESIIWNATRLGEHQMTLAIPVQDEEYNSTNNQLRFRIAVREEEINVLIIDSLPRWEYRFLRNAMSRDPGVNVDCLLLHPGLPPGGGKDYIQSFPDSRDKISKYDVVFLGDVGIGENELTSEHLELVRGLVEQQGSGLVFLPGIRGRQQTLLNSAVAEMMPVILDDQPKGFSFTQETPLILTRSGSNHLLTMLADSGTTSSNMLLWRNLPGFYWNAGISRAKPGTDVLATHQTMRNRWGHLPLLVTRPFGNGNVLFMGTDSAWRWRRGVEDTYHYRFWGQVARWMAHPRRMAYRDGIRLFFTPENPQQNDTVFLQATVFDASGFPLNNATVTANIHSPDGHIEQRQLSPLQGGWGVYKGSFTARRAGTYRLEIESHEAATSLTTHIEISHDMLEKVGLPARFVTLREICRMTHGSFGLREDLDRIVQEINLIPEDEEIIRRKALWSSWWWGLVMVGLFSTYWVLRKKWGLI